MLMRLSQLVLVVGVVTDMWFAGVDGWVVVGAMVPPLVGGGPIGLLGRVLVLPLVLEVLVLPLGRRASHHASCGGMMLLLVLLHGGAGRCRRCRCRWRLLHY